MNIEEIAHIAADFGTPSFVLDVEAFQDRLRACKGIVGEGIDLCFAMKANPFLIRAAVECGAKLEVCSPGELALCERAGIDPARVVYSGVNKEEVDIAEAMRFGAGALTAESLLHVKYLDDVARRHHVVLDIIPRLNAGSQFGMSHADLMWLIDHRADFSGVRIVGLHYFVGTQRRKLKHQRRELAMLVDLITEAKREHGFTFERLEYGPGLAVPYFVDDDFSDTLAPLRELADDLRAVASHVRFTIEMGRFFAAECGVYLTRSMDLKSNDGTNYAILDGGMNHLSYYGQMMGLHVPRLVNVSQEARKAGDEALSTALAKAPQAPEAFFAGDGPASREPATRAAAVPGEALGEVASLAGATASWCLCGSLCTVNDVLVRSIDMEDLRQGDVLAFGNAGAYSVTEGVYLFLSRTMPRILLRHAGGEVELVRDFKESSLLNGFDS